MKDMAPRFSEMFFRSSIRFRLLIKENFGWRLKVVFVWELISFMMFVDLATRWGLALHKNLRSF